MYNTAKGGGEVPLQNRAPKMLQFHVTYDYHNSGGPPTDLRGENIKVARAISRDNTSRLLEVPPQNCASKEVPLQTLLK